MEERKKDHTYTRAQMKNKKIKPVGRAERSCLRNEVADANSRLLAVDEQEQTNKQGKQKHGTAIYEKRTSKRDERANKQDKENEEGSEAQSTETGIKKTNKSHT